VLVTDRIGIELEAEFPDITTQFDGVVLENGAVTEIDGTSSALAAPVDTTLDDALTMRGIPTDGERYGWLPTASTPPRSSRCSASLDWTAKSCTIGRR
jgi:hypothetical protein